MRLQPELQEAWAELLSIQSADDVSDWTKKYGDKKTKNRESQTLEYKVEPHRENILKACCAFANSIGGIVLIGVADELTERDADSNVKGGCNILGANRRDYREEVRKYIRDGFYYTFPNIEIEYIKSVKLTVILVYGNERELLLTQSADTGLCGYRRRGDNSEPFSMEEIIAVADRFYRQRDMLIERYRRKAVLLTHGIDSYKSADLLLSALPIPAFSSVSSTRSIEPFYNAISSYLPHLTIGKSSDGVSLTYAKVSEGQSIEFYCRVLDSGFYHLNVKSIGVKKNGNWVAEPVIYARMMVIAVYFCLIQSSFSTDAKAWAIQGAFNQFDSNGDRKRVEQVEPILITLPLDQMILETPFPAIADEPDRVEDFVQIMVHLADLLGVQICEPKQSAQETYEQLKNEWDNSSLS